MHTKAIFANNRMFNNFANIVYNNINSITTIKTCPKLRGHKYTFNVILILFSFILNISESVAQSPVDSTDKPSVNGSGNALITENNTWLKPRINWTNLPFFFDDLMLTGGLNRSGIYFSSNYRELSMITGYQLGIENYYPIMDKAFIHYGVQFSARGFVHQNYDIRFRTFNFDFPVYLAYELPALREYDLRLLLGGQLSKRSGATESKSYPAETQITYRYRPSQFAPFDVGFTAGISAESTNHFIRLRMFQGYFKLMPDEQGMNSAFFFDYGYFIFRGLRK